MGSPFSNFFWDFGEIYDVTCRHVVRVHSRLGPEILYLKNQKKYLQIARKNLIIVLKLEFSRDA